MKSIRRRRSSSRRMSLASNPVGSKLPGQGTNDDVLYLRLPSRPRWKDRSGPDRAGIPAVVKLGPGRKIALRQPVLCYNSGTHPGSIRCRTLTNPRKGPAKMAPNTLPLNITDREIIAIDRQVRLPMRSL